MKAAPISKIKIQQITRSIREILNLKPDDKVDIISLLENIIIPVFDLRLEIVEKKDMTDKYAEYKPINKVIKIREDTYENAIKGIGRDRFTISHEIGHIFLHSDNISMARSNEKIPVYCNPEWQANTFAREFLCPLNSINEKDDINSLSEKFGISKEVASIQLKQKK